MSGQSTPVKDSFTGEPMTKRVRADDSINIASYASAWKWDGRPKYNSWYH